MRDVKLVRLSDDGTHLVLTHEGTGEEFALRVDDRLRGAVVSDRARQGALPMERQSRLRPKEIQARLRAGESSESIAEAAGVSLERILRYAGPVLAEREYIAEQARRCALRRNGRDGPGQILEEAVGKRLDDLQVGRDHATWDAWRSSEGRWMVAVSFTYNGTDHRALFGYDPLGRVVTTADDKARALVGEPNPAVPGVVDDLPTAATPPRDAARHTPGPAATPRPLRDGQRLHLAPVPPPEPAADAATGNAAEAEDTVALARAFMEPQHRPQSAGSYEPTPPAPNPFQPAPSEPAPLQPRHPHPHVGTGLSNEPAHQGMADVAATTGPRTDDGADRAVADAAVPARPVEPVERAPEAEPAQPVEQAEPDDEPADGSDARAGLPRQPERRDDPDAEAADADSEARPQPRRPRSADARRRRARSSGRRGSVPSWDDILFGGARPQE